MSTKKSYPIPYHESPTDAAMTDDPCCSSAGKNFPDIPPPLPTVRVNIDRNLLLAFERLMQPLIDRQDERLEDFSFDEHVAMSGWFIDRVSLGLTHEEAFDQVWREYSMLCTRDEIENWIEAGLGQP